MSPPTFTAHSHTCASPPAFRPFMRREAVNDSSRKEGFAKPTRRIRFDHHTKLPWIAHLKPPDAKPWVMQFRLRQAKAPPRDSPRVPLMRRDAINDSNRGERCAKPARRIRSDHHTKRPWIAHLKPQGAKPLIMYLQRCQTKAPPMDSTRLSGQLARPPRCYEAQTGTHSGARIYQGSHGHALERALPRAGIFVTGRTGTPSDGRPLERSYLPRVGRARRQTCVPSSGHIYHGSSGHALGRASVLARGDHLARLNQLAAHDRIWQILQPIA